MRCPSCGYENIEGAQYCNLCQTSFVKKTEPESPGPTQTPSVPKATLPTGLRRDERELNWFRRHLNWTWILAQLAIFLISFAFMCVLAIVIIHSPAFNIGYVFTGASMLINMVWILTIVTAFGVGAWVLKEKDRSLAWLLIIPIPFGWFFFLMLDNRNNILPLPAFNPAEPPAESPSKYWL
jgi:hypothetical protein